jgi:hypothetical protein
MGEYHLQSFSVCIQKYWGLLLIGVFFVLFACTKKEASTSSPLLQVKLDKELISAVKQSDVEKVKSLLAQGASPNAHQVRTWKLSLIDRERMKQKKMKDLPTLSVLHISVGLWEPGDADQNRVEHLWESHKYDPKILPYTPNPTIIKLLVEAGANVNEYTPETMMPMTPLCAATKWMDVDMVEYLIHKGARLNDSRPISEPLAHGLLQLERDNSVVVESLLKHGADPNKGLPLLLMYGPGRLNYVRLLVKYGANINATNDKGETLLRQMKRAVKEEALLPPSQDVIDLLEKMGAKDEVVKLPKKSSKKSKN